MKRAALLISLLAVAVVWLTAVPVLASPQPSPVCGACGSSFEDVAEDHGTTAAVTASTASIQINPNGSATWVVTNRLNQSPADFSNNPELLTRISREAATNRGVANRDGTEATFQSATLENRTVHIRFRDPDAGSRHLGVLVVDYFHSAGVRGGWILNADPISVSGPDGTVVLNDPRAVINDEHASDDELPTVTGHTVEWMNTSTDGQRAIFADDVYLAFGSSETSSLQREAALTVASLPIWLDNLWSYVVPAVFGYGILLTGVAVGARRAADTEFSVDRLAAVVAGSGGAFLGLAAFGVLPATLVGVGAIYVIVGGTTWYRPELLRSTRGTLAIGLASLGGVATTVWGVSFLDARFASLAPTFVHAMVIHLPLAVAPVFGHAVRRRGATDATVEIAAGFAGASVALLLAGGVFVPFDARPFGLIIVFTLGGAVAAALLGLPLAMLGASQPTPQTPYETNRASLTPAETVDDDDS